MSDRHQQLVQMPLQLKLPAFATGISSLALKASRKGLSHEAFLYELARLECEQRLQNRIERLLVQSRRQREKTLDKFKLEKLDAALRLQVERLSSGKFVKEAINVITFIFNPAFQASRSKSLTHYR